MTTTLTIYDITCTILITSHALYMTSHLLCIMSHSLCVLHHTVTLSMTSNNICLWHIHLLWHHAQCYDHTAIVCVHSPYAWHYTQCILTLNTLYQCYEKKCMYVITASIYVWHHTHYIWHHIHSLWYHKMLWHSHTLYSCHHTQDTSHCIDCCWALTYNVLNIAHLQYMFSQSHYMYDIIWILWDITTALYDITRLDSWHHINTIHDITPTVYNMTYTLLVTSQPL